jgi:hypothetical protein
MKPHTFFFLIGLAMLAYAWFSKTIWASATNNRGNEERVLRESILSNVASQIGAGAQQFATPHPSAYARNFTPSTGLQFPNIERILNPSNYK